MRLVLQRVSRAEVRVQGSRVGAIGKGILALLGVQAEDTRGKVPWFINKMLNLRIFEDDAKKMNLSVKDVKGEVMVVSQFTLYANCHSGMRPDFLQAAPPRVAEPIYHYFVEQIEKEMGGVQTGIFGACMEVSLVNDGPVTIILDEKNQKE